VTDLQLVDGDGLTFATELRSRQPDASVIITTGFDVEQRGSGDLLDSGSCYLKKPWTDLELAQAVVGARESYVERRSLTTALLATPGCRVLLVDDQSSDTVRLLAQLEQSRACSEIKCCHTLTHAKSVLRERTFDAVLLGITRHEGEPEIAIELLQAAAPDAAIFSVIDHEPDAGSASAASPLAPPYLIPRSAAPETWHAALRHGIERKHQERKLTYVAHHDPLTQLLNRTAFSEQVAEALAASRATNGCCAVMHFNVGGFKSLNETHGADAGDTVLCEIGRRIQASVREEDVVARLGSDEFGVLLAQVDDAVVCARVAQRIVDITCLPVLLRDDVQLLLRATVGIAVSPESGNTAEALLRAADSAMRSAKSQGDSYMVHEPAKAKARAPKRAG
jgi:diguanylate cyclase (GGDEF)-like protein